MEKADYYVKCYCKECVHYTQVECRKEECDCC